jgi:hypothetical protein
MCSSNARGLLRDKCLMPKNEENAYVSGTKSGRGVWQVRKMNPLQELVLQLTTSMKALPVGEKLQR